jgi:protein archease
VTRARYRLLPHTADLRVEVRAEEFPGLCAASVEALFSLLTDRRKVRRAVRKTLECAGGAPEEQLLALLKQALLLFSLDRFLVRDADATMKGAGVVLAVFGEPADGARHPVYREIKAVTAHAMAVEQEAAGFNARFVLDV